MIKYILTLSLIISSSCSKKTDSIDQEKDSNILLEESKSQNAPSDVETDNDLQIESLREYVKNVKDQDSTLVLLTDSVIEANSELSLANSRFIMSVSSVIDTNRASRVTVMAGGAYLPRRLTGTLNDGSSKMIMLDVIMGKQAELITSDGKKTLITLENQIELSKKYPHLIPEDVRDFATFPQRIPDGGLVRLQRDRGDSGFTEVYGRAIGPGNIAWFTDTKATSTIFESGKFSFQLADGRTMVITGFNELRPNTLLKGDIISDLYDQLGIIKSASRLQEAHNLHVIPQYVINQGKITPLQPRNINPEVPIPGANKEFVDGAGATKGNKIEGEEAAFEGLPEWVAKSDEWPLGSINHRFEPEFREVNGKQELVGHRYILRVRDIDTKTGKKTWITIN